MLTIRICKSVRIVRSGESALGLVLPRRFLESVRTFLCGCFGAGAVQIKNLLSLGIYMAKFVKRRITRRPRKYARKPKRDAKKVPKATKRYISRVIHSNLENKRMTTEFTKNLFNIAGGLTGFLPNNIIPLCPNSLTGGIYTITQGVGQQQRVSNSISVRKAYLRGVLLPAQYNAISNPTPTPTDVKMWIFSLKRNVLQQSCADVYNTLNATFFANGNTSIGLLGNLYDTITPNNKEVVNLHYTRTFKIAYASYAGMTGGSSATDAKTNNDYKYHQKMTLDITRWLPKKMFFNDTDSGTTSKQVYCVFEPIYANGAAHTAATSSCGFIGGIDLHYEDS